MIDRAKFAQISNVIQIRFSTVFRNSLDFSWTLPAPELPAFLEKARLFRVSSDCHHSRTKLGLHSTQQEIRFSIFHLLSRTRLAEIFTCASFILVFCVRLHCFLSFYYFGSFRSFKGKANVLRWSARLSRILETRWRRRRRISKEKSNQVDQEDVSALNCHLRFNSLVRWEKYFN